MVAALLLWLHHRDPRGVPANGNGSSDEVATRRSYHETHEEMNGAAWGYRGNGMEQRLLRSFLALRIPSGAPGGRSQQAETAHETRTVPPRRREPTLLLTGEKTNTPTKTPIQTGKHTKIHPSTF